MKKLTDLRDDEVKDIINDLYHPDEIKRIDISKRFDQINVVVSFRWETVFDKNKSLDEVEKNNQEHPVDTTHTIILRNPFYKDMKQPIETNLYCGEEKIKMFKQFCLAKRIVGEESLWILDNPYFEIESEYDLDFRMDDKFDKAKEAFLDFQEAFEEIAEKSKTIHIRKVDFALYDTNKLLHEIDTLAFPDNIRIDMAEQILKNDAVLNELAPTRMWALDRRTEAEKEFDEAEDLARL